MPPTPTYSRAQLMIADQKVFDAGMAGNRWFVHWEPKDPAHDVVFLFYVPRLRLYRLNHETFELFKPKIDPEAKVNVIVHAIKANRSCAQTNKIWDGGDVAEAVLEMLKGKPSNDELFLNAAEPDKPELTPEMIEETEVSPTDAPKQEGTDMKKPKKATKAKKPAKAKAPKVDPNSVAGIFNVREGSDRHKLMTKLFDNIGKPFSFKDLNKIVKGAKAQVRVLTGTMKKGKVGYHFVVANKGDDEAIALKKGAA